MATKKLLEKLGFNLSDGLYILTQTVANPFPDKRCKGNFPKAVQWEKGLLIKVKTFACEDDAPEIVERLKYQLPVMRAWKAGMTEDLIVMDENRAQWQSLVAWMQPAPPMLGKALDEVSDMGLDDDAACILAWLLNTGKVKYEDILHAAQDMAGRIPEGTWWDWRKENGI